MVWYSPLLNNFLLDIVVWVLSLCYIWTPYQIFCLQIFFQVQFATILIGKCLAFLLQSCSVGWKPIGVLWFPVFFPYKETHFCFPPPHVQKPLTFRSLWPMLISRSFITSGFVLICFTESDLLWDQKPMQIFTGSYLISHGLLLKKLLFPFVYSPLLCCRWIDHRNFNLFLDSQLFFMDLILCVLFITSTMLSWWS